MRIAAWSSARQKLPTKRKRNQKKTKTSFNEKKEKKLKKESPIAARRFNAGTAAKERQVPKMAEAQMEKEIDELNPSD